MRLVTSIQACMAFGSSSVANRLASSFHLRAGTTIGNSVSSARLPSKCCFAKTLFRCSLHTGNSGAFAWTPVYKGCRGFRFKGWSLDSSRRAWKGLLEITIFFRIWIYGIEFTGLCLAGGSKFTRTVMAFRDHVCGILEPGHSSTCF